MIVTVLMKRSGRTTYVFNLRSAMYVPRDCNVCLCNEFDKICLRLFNKENGAIDCVPYQVKCVFVLLLYDEK